MKNHLKPSKSSVRQKLRSKLRKSESDLRRSKKINKQNLSKREQDLLESEPFLVPVDIDMDKINKTIAEGKITFEDGWNDDPDLEKTTPEDISPVETTKITKNKIKYWPLGTAIIIASAIYAKYIGLF